MLSPVIFFVKATKYQSMEKLKILPPSFILKKMSIYEKNFKSLPPYLIIRYFTSWIIYSPFMIEKLATVSYSLGNGQGTLL